MSAVAVDTLLNEISAESPAGTNLEYDPDYMEMMRLSQGVPERQMGTTILPAEEPNWRDVKDRCLELLKRTKDLAVAIKLCESLVRTAGVPGLRDGLAVVAGLVTKYWDQFYPQLDPSDGNDPTYRLNILAGLNDGAFLGKVRTAPLTNSPRAGRYGLREVLWASGRLQPPADASVPKPDVINAAFRDTPPEELIEVAQSTEQATATVKEIDAQINQRVGLGKGVDFQPLLKVLQEMAATIKPHVPAGTVADAAAGNGEAAGQGSTGTAGGGSVPGEINTPEDVVAALERICAYYERHERSSPVPILLRRVQRVVGKDMLEILRELLPEAVKPMENLGGIREEATG
jgi:type VI secretion system protein ImpA